MDAHISTPKNGEFDRFFVIPYIDKISDALGNTIKGFNCRTAFVGMNKLNRFVKPHKDLLHNFAQRGVVYKIDCRDCDASYVGQTGRQLGTRVKEHRNQLGGKGRITLAIAVGGCGRCCC